MKSMELFEMDVYHLSLSYALECLHKCIIGEFLEGKFRQAES